MRACLRSRRYRPWCLLLLLGVLPATAQAAAADRIFHDGLEHAFVPLSTDRAAHFLNQASFGATGAEIAALMGSRYDLWIDAQLALAPTLSRPMLEQVAANENTAGRAFTQEFRVQRWVDVAVTAPDQLRQRMAWALGQIVVASDRDGALFDEPIMMAEWGDLFVRHALGNYRDLLAEVSRSPIMGRYLSHLRNRKFELTPRCRDLRDGGSTPVACNSAAATDDDSQTPVIVRYDPPANGVVAPDENYAREVMQLFSIGLIERAADFSPILIDGATVPTYDQQMIATMARVFTGLSYACSGPRTVAGVLIARNCGGCSGTTCSFNLTALTSLPPAASLGGQDDLVHPDRYQPMICYPRIHDHGRDLGGFRLPGEAALDPPGASIELDPGERIPAGTPDGHKALVLGGVELARIDEVAAGQPPAGAPQCDSFALDAPAQQQCLDYCNADLDTAVELLFQHPNTASMLARQLIQRLVDSNPSPAYIARVAAVFADDGTGVRGNLAAVARTILLDAEARRPPWATGTPASAGKPREPLLKLIHLWRALGAQSGEQRADGFRRWARFAALACRPPQWPQCAFAQRPHGAPTVFNFYAPDYRQPGPIADAGLYSPELQIVHENSVILAANDLLLQLCSGYGADDCSAPLVTPPGDSAYIPPQALDALSGGDCAADCTADDDIALLDALDDRLFGGAMDGSLGNPALPADAANRGTRGALFRLLREGLPAGLGEADPQDGRRRQILYLVHLIAIAPAFAAQR